MKKHMSKKKKIVIVVLCAIAMIAISTAIVFALSKLEQRWDVAPESAGQSLSRTNADIELSDPTKIPGHAAQPNDEDNNQESDAVYYNGKLYQYNKNLSTILVLGIDDAELTETASSRNSSQADFILLAVFDPNTQKCTLIQLNRDTMCDVPVLDTFGHYYALENEQLALAHTYGDGLEASCENTVNAVSRFMYGITIDNYFALTMDAVPILNDMVGGVTVTIEDDFTGVDDSLVQGEAVTLTGENVMHYVRERKGITDDPTNLNRMNRQKEYMYSLIDAVKNKVDEDSAFVLDAYVAIADYLVTDCSVTEITNYSNQFSNYSLSEIVSPDGEAVVGDKFMEFYVDEDALQQLVIDTFYVYAG